MRQQLNPLRAIATLCLLVLGQQNMSAQDSLATDPELIAFAQRYAKAMIDWNVDTLFKYGFQEEKGRGVLRYDPKKTEAENLATQKGVAAKAKTELATSMPHLRLTQDHKATDYRMIEGETPDTKLIKVMRDPTAPQWCEVRNVLTYNKEGKVWHRGLQLRYMNGRWYCTRLT